MLTFKLPSFLFISLFLSCSSINANSIEKLKYDTLIKEKSMEIRKYKPYLVATVQFDLSKGETRGDAFRMLFKYISGDNKGKRKISMTAPVTIEKGQKISMTSPVTITTEGNIRSMSFMVPSKYTKKTVPLPSNPRVKIREIAERLVAVNQFSWFAGQAKQQKKTLELATWLKDQNQYEIVSQAIYAGYNAPFTLPFLKTHEMMFEVEKK